MDIGNPYIVVIAASLVVILSFFFSQIARRTYIPSVLLLVALGLGIRELLVWLDADQGNAAFRVLEVVGIVGLIMIVLEGALDLRLTEEKHTTIYRSLFAALFGLVAATGIIAAVLQFVFAMTPFTSWLYAIPLATLSSAIVIPSVTRLAVVKKEFLVYESTFSDIFGILFFNVMIRNADGGAPVMIGAMVVGNLALSVAIALVISVGLVVMFHRMESDLKLFFLLAVLVLLYALGKQLDLSALVIVLVFGLVVNNPEVFFRGRMRQWIHDERLDAVVKNLHVVTIETSFIVRTFFFVIFGMTLTLSDLVNPRAAFLSVALIMLVYVLRVLTLKLAGMKSIRPELYIAPRGLVTVLLFFAIPAQHQSAVFDPAILLYIILGTSLIMTYGLVVYGREKEWVESLSFDDWDKVDSELKGGSKTSEGSGT